MDISTFSPSEIFLAKVFEILLSSCNVALQMTSAFQGALLCWGKDVTYLKCLFNLINDLQNLTLFQF